MLLKNFNSSLNIKNLFANFPDLLLGTSRDKVGFAFSSIGINII
jgi:hypothetical protein